MQDQPSVLIVGTGAMACLFGSRLAAHAQVTLLGTWPEGVSALQQHGIRVVTDSEVEQVRVQVARHPGDCAGQSQALVLVKSWQTARAADQLAQCLDPGGVALTLQNGLGNLEILQHALGKERAALGVTTTGATLVGPGQVRAGGSGPTHVARQPRLAALVALLRSAGFEVHEADDLEGLLWGKLAINAGINPLTALLGVPNGRLLELPTAREVLRKAAREAADVATARGVQLPYEDASGRTEEVAHLTAANLSSMLQDIRRGAPTEIDAICGAIVQEGERLGTPTPVNWALWKLVKAHAEGESQ